MNNLEEKQRKLSNQEVDWATHYDFYEVELREMYRTNSIPQNGKPFWNVKMESAQYNEKG